MTRRALFAVNPVARGVPSLDKLRRAEEWLRGQEWTVDVSHTEEAGHAIELARQAATEGYDAVVACGGDGTVNEAANGLAGSATALAVIPGGTANVWAKEVRIPRDPLKAVRLLVEGQMRRIDLGLVERALPDVPPRYFLLMAGIGLDGHIVSIVPERMKKRLGAAAYIVHGLREALRYRTTTTTLQIDSEPFSVDLNWLLVSNTRSYGGVIDVAHHAVADDGLLDVYLFSGHGLRRMFGHGMRILARRHDRGPNVLHVRAREIDLAQPCALPIQIDGDFLGVAPLTIRVAPDALSVVLPRDLRTPLFQKDAAASD